MKYSYVCFFFSFQYDRIADLMVSVLVSSAVDHRFEPCSGQTEHYKIGICCFSAKHAALSSKSKYWMTRNQDNMSEWSDISTCRLALWKSNKVCWSTVQSRHHHHSIKCNLFSSWYGWKIAYLEFNNKHT